MESQNYDYPATIYPVTNNTNTTTNSSISADPLSSSQPQLLLLENSQTSVVVLNTNSPTLSQSSQIQTSSLNSISNNVNQFSNI
ncbi:hypothetical protein Glove_214g50 [Diversispora epigaea]|uniref:Uncharacterized protein n=1 Tax=Diversispora epigaea TaxID=1348612 RepID=A0A397IR33_9GLOM|nr:hypothetical protein Glove_214g50 [Diversispora epigaea]